MSFDQNTVTGSMVRDMMLGGAITRVQAADDPMTIANVGLLLPDDFCASDEELQAMLAHMNGESVAASDTPPPAAEPDAEAEPQLSETEARERVRSLIQQLATARGNVMAMTQTQRHARKRLSDTVTAFQVGAGALKTPEQNAREYIASELALRAARANGELVEEDRGGGPGPSVVDRMAFGHGARHGTRRDSWRRGAYPASMKGAFVGRPKIPSER
jgi:hypothetical protein